jgi:hypothetical protein
MAERRMFAKSIINSGRFLKMPPTSRLLYYDLGMMADDDGIVEAYSVMTQTKATEDDLRVLVAKGYVRILNEDLVTVICDWKTNNTIRSDRYHQSIYAELICQPTDNQLTTNGIPTDNQMETEVRLGKVSIGKDSIELGDCKGEGEPSPNPKNPKRFVKPSLDEVIAYCQERRNSVNPEKFIDYYESNGWKVGKNSMKDWKAAVRTWERNSFQSNKPKEEYHTPTEADYDFSDWYK